MRDLQRYDIYSHDGPLCTDFVNTKEYVSFIFIYIYKSREVKKTGKVGDRKSCYFHLPGNLGFVFS